jgi:DNA-binding HxlR family transcriptional regulator
LAEPRRSSRRNTLPGMEPGSPTKFQVRGHRQWTPLARGLAAMGDRWTLLIVLAISHERVRLSALRTRLPGISSGVLDHHLSRMSALGLLSRERYREMPPRVEVTLTEAGKDLLPIACAIARWGMRHDWPLPPSSVYVRADAVLRQLPALLEEEDDLPNGTIEVIVGADEERTAHWFEIAGGRLQAASEQAAEATVQIEGNDAAWIAALGPARDYSGLDVGGQHQLAKRILDSLSRAYPPEDEIFAEDGDSVEDGGGMERLSEEAMEGARD